MAFDRQHTESGMVAEVIDKDDDDSKSGFSDMLDVCGKILNTLNHGLIAIVTFYTCWLCFSVAKVGYFELHIALTTLGYQFLMAETILALAGENGWTHSMRRNTKRIVHWVMAIIGIALSIAGTSMIISEKSVHFTSTHGILGLAAMVLLVPTFMNGPILFFARHCNKKVKPVYLKIYHTLTSSAAFCVGVACLITGYQQRWFRRQVSQEMVTCFIVFSSITIVLTMKIPLYNLFHFCKSLFR